MVVAGAFVLNDEKELFMRCLKNYLKSKYHLFRTFSKPLRLENVEARSFRFQEIQSGKTQVSLRY